MKVVRRNDGEERLATNPLFVGTVHSKPMVSTDEAQVGVSLVRFTDGAKNKFHTHTADQLLYITEGEGIVADRDQEHRVSAGDIVHVPRGTVHWHGAAPGHSMAHLSILPPSTTEMVE
jgi:quercetin dioxygenase-like cupin family protein